jgi:long-chain acyl-CoA synthetase
MIALIVPNVTALKELAQQLGNRSEKLEDLCRDEKILENVTKELFKFGTSVGLNRMEIPTKVKLCSEEWTTTNALVTPALKIRRKNIQKFYELDINRMYAKDK